MNRRALVRSVGLVAVAASLGFLVYELRDGVTELDRSDLTGELVVRWLVAFVLYTAGLFLVHLAWGRVVSHAHQGLGPLAPTMVSGRAQIGKYLPGNVGHLAGRQVLAAQRGWSQQAVAAASVAEIVGFVCAGAIVVGVGAALGVSVDLDLPGWIAPVLVALLVVAVVVVVVLAATHRLRRIREGLLAAGRVTPQVIALHVAFLISAGVAQWLLLDGSDLGTVIVAASAALLVGFLTPGVPAGVGVREAVLAGALSVDASTLAVGLIAFRAATVLGDLVTFVAAGWLRPAAERSPVVSDTDR